MEMEQTETQRHQRQVQDRPESTENADESDISSLKKAWELMFGPGNTFSSNGNTVLHKNFMLGTR
jgi:hypothetical protein